MSTSLLYALSFLGRVGTLAFGPADWLQMTCAIFISFFFSLLLRLMLKFKATTKQYQPIKRRRRHGIQRQSLQGTFMVNNSVLTLRKNVSQRLISSELFLKYIKRIGCIISSFSLVQNLYLVPEKTLDHTNGQFLHPPFHKLTKTIIIVFSFHF